MLQCAFCLREVEITGEHIWSQWIGKALSLKTVSYLRTHANGTSDEWISKGLNAKARVVCGTCNNGWLSDLETQSQSILRSMICNGTETVLRDRDIALIAAVAFKNAVVADQMHGNYRSFFTASERRRFGMDLTIPAGVQMWVSSMARQLGVYKSDYGRVQLGRPDDVEMNNFTYAVGHYVVQVVTSRWTDEEFRGQAVPPFVTQNPVWDDVSIPIWPNVLEVVWPSRMHLGDEVVEQFCQRWKQLKRGG